MEDDPDTYEQRPNSAPSGKARSLAAIQPFQFRKGQSGNPAGRPKGKTMKDYAREMLECMTDEERQEFMHGLPKEIIWKMAEGNPESKTDLTSLGKAIAGFNFIKNGDDNTDNTTDA
jgi:hypothetical protein